MAKAFDDLEEVRPPTGDNLMIVDALNLAFRYKHSKTKDFAESYINTVNSLAKSYSSSKIVIAADWGSSTYRMNLYPEYKGDRKEKFALQTEEEKEEFKEFFEDFEECLEACKEHFLVLRYKGVEADDIAAYITHHLPLPNVDDIWLISTDGDWDYLLKDNIHRFSYLTRKEYKLDTWNKMYPHEHMLGVKVLWGGKDNVQGIPGIGEKRASDLMKQFNGDVLELYASLPLPGTAKYIKSLNEHKERILLNVELIDKIEYCIPAIGQGNRTDIKLKLGEYLT